MPDFATNPMDLVPLYRAMVLTRTFDCQVRRAAAHRPLGTYAPSFGQEAVPVGLASAMRRGRAGALATAKAAQIWRGVRLAELLQYWAGNERGSASSGPCARLADLHHRRQASAARSRRRLALK